MTFLLQYLPLQVILLIKQVPPNIQTTLSAKLILPLQIKREPLSILTTFPHPY